MNYKIVVDSCGELTEEMKQSGYFESVAMSIELEGSTIVDDETFDQADFLKTDCSQWRMSEVVLPISGTLYGKLCWRSGTCIRCNIDSRT